jgi:hypothetical protein
LRRNSERSRSFEERLHGAHSRHVALSVLLLYSL